MPKAKEEKPKKRKSIAQKLARRKSVHKEAHEDVDSR